MKIIFLGTTAVHAALVAAYIYMEKLDKRDLNNINGVGDVYLEAKNKVLFIGTDQNGNDVYTFGAGRELLMVKKTIEDLRNLLGYKKDDLKVVIITTPGDRILAWLLKIPLILGGQNIARQLSVLVLSKYFDLLNNTIAQLKSSISASPG